MFSLGSELIRVFKAACQKITLCFKYNIYCVLLHFLGRVMRRVDLSYLRRISGN